MDVGSHLLPMSRCQLTDEGGSDSQNGRGELLECKTWRRCRTQGGAQTERVVAGRRGGSEDRHHGRPLLWSLQRWGDRHRRAKPGVDASMLAGSRRGLAGCRCGHNDLGCAATFDVRRHATRRPDGLQRVVPAARLTHDQAGRDHERGTQPDEEHERAHSASRSAGSGFHHSHGGEVCHDKAFERLSPRENSSIYRSQRERRRLRDALSSAMLHR